MTHRGFKKGLIVECFYFRAKMIRKNTEAPANEFIGEMIEEIYPHHMNTIGMKSSRLIFIIADIKRLIW